MNSRVSWSVEGIDPSVRERAEAAARRAGMSLNDWLNSTIGDSAPPSFPRAAPEPRSMMPSQETPRRRRHSPAAGFDHPPDRTDFAARRRATDAFRAAICRAPMRPQRRRPPEPAVARQLNDAISRLDARLSQISNPRRPDRPSSGQAAPGRDGRARRRPGLSPLAAAQPGLARFRDRGNRCAPERTRSARHPRPMPPRSTPPIAPSMPARPPVARGPGFFLAGAPSVQDHQPDRGAAASRRNRAIDRRVPQRTRRNSSRHHRGDAAPGDRIDRERNPLAVPPHRRKPPERHRRPGAGRHRTRARPKFAKCCAR